MSFESRATGSGRCFSAEYKKPAVTLAQGKLEPTGRQSWRHMELAFHGSQISASLDGTVLASVHDLAHTHGMFGIGTGWNRAKFDDISVTCP